MKTDNNKLIHLIIHFLFVIIILVMNTRAAKNDSINGLIIDKNGTPVKDVEICIFESDLQTANSKINNLSSYAIHCAKSDQAGIYNLTIDSEKRVTIIGRKKNTWFFQPMPQNEKTLLIDTLKSCGSLCFYVRLDKSKQHDNVTASLIGTPFSAKSDKNGAITFSCISPGAYMAIISSSQPGYTDVQCSLRIVESEIDTFPDTLVVPFAGVNRIKITKASYDTSNSVIEMRWDSNIPNVKEYHIFRKMENKPKTVQPYSIVKVPYFRDSLVSLHSQSRGYSIDNNAIHTIKYSIMAKNQKKIIENISDSAQFTTSNRKKDLHSSIPAKQARDSTKAIIDNDPPSVNAGNDTTAGIHDEITLNGTASVKRGKIINWEWSINKAPFSRHESGKITITTPLITREPLVCILKVTSDNGLQALDTVTIRIQSSPPVVKISGDSVVGMFDTIHQYGCAKDNGAIVSMGWDIGNKGIFTFSNDGKISAAPLRAPHDSLICIFRAIDDDGETVYDTSFVKVHLTWKTITPTTQIPERKGHALVNFNGMLWIIGGNQSDIWNSTDGKQWQKITDLAPFGERFGHSVTAFNGQLILIGGKDSEDRYTNDIWSSSDGKEWRKVLDADFLKRHYHSVTQFIGRLWLIGGLGESGYEASLNDIWSSEDGVRWKPEKDVASFSRRYGHGANVLRNSFIITGGFYEGFNGTTTLKDTWSSTDGVNWNSIKDSAAFEESVFHSFLEYDNRLWSIGGFCKSCSDNGRFTNIYHTKNGSDWETLVKSPEKGLRLFNASTVFNDRIFISPSDAQNIYMLQ